ncbi:MAG TPA: BTAD domain-containing putative transcriptional regulator, partial [Ktedonobacteraceae bacterium]|nr:BTAD domain-containing putative transcriptional regulator [Ktedonobacteraceae bacterium]
MIGARISLEISTLGRFEIRREQELLSGGNWNRRKVCELFKVLLSADQHRLHREQVQEILWPSSSSEQAANSFGKTLYLLRRALEPELATGKGSSSTYVTLDHDTVMLAQDSLQIDADLFESAARQLQVKMRNRATKEHNEQGSLLDEFDGVLSLYGGDYLPEDLYEEWAQRRRDRLRRTYSWLLENAAELAVENAMGLRACEYLQALLERNSADEQTHRQLMLIYARMGRRSDALNQYQLLREALREELRTNPLPETVELYRTIQAGRIMPDLAGPHTKAVTRPLSESAEGDLHVHAHPKNDVHTPLAGRAASHPSGGSASAHPDVSRECDVINPVPTAPDATLVGTGFITSA